MILSLCLTVLIITTITCEPPLNNYLPPGAGSGSRSDGRPASQYGPPESNQGRFGGFNLGRGQPRDSFDPSGRVNSGSQFAEYGPPGQGSQGFQGGSRGPQFGNSSPSSQFRSPNQEGLDRARGSTDSGRGSSQTPESSYGTPVQGLLSAGPNGFKGQGGSSQGSRRPFGGSPSTTYGTPDFGNDRDNTNQNYRRSGVDESNNPAKYQFSYEVDDVETGTMFGHSEQRNGDLTTGQYNVVLPDGRKQVVQYEANKDGYKPQIRYEGTGRRGAVSGFERGASRGNGGQEYPGIGANTDEFANAQPGIAIPGGRHQQSDFGQGTSGGYPSGRPGNDEDSFGDLGFPRTRGSLVSGNSGRSGGSGFTGRTPDGGFPGGLAGQDYSSGTQGGRGFPRRGGLGSNNGGGNEGYPSGGPSGARGSGY